MGTQASRTSRDFRLTNLWKKTERLSIGYSCRGEKKLDMYMYGDYTLASSMITPSAVTQAELVLFERTFPSALRLRVSDSGSESRLLVDPACRGAVPACQCPSSGSKSY
eukprot:2967236-Rhodomonas_salina.1